MVFGDARRAPGVVVAVLLVVCGATWGLACDTSSDAASVAATLDAGAAATCPVAAPSPEASAPYHPPRAASNACSAGIGAFAARFFERSPPPTYTELQTTIAADPTLGGAACAACVFAKEEEALWGPIVFAAGGSGAATLNWGSCFARAEGGTEACGEAVQRSRACVDAVCSKEDCVTTSAANTCSQRALGEPTGCGRYPVDATCGDLLAPLSKSCATLADLLNVTCASTQGTTDAGAGDGG